MNDQLRKLDEQHDADLFGRMIIYVIISILVIGVVIGYLLSEYIKPIIQNL